MKKYIKYFLAIGIVVLIIGYLLMANIAASEAKQCISLYDRKKYESISKKTIQDYDDFIKNEDFKKYSLLRDEYNIEWYTKANKKLDTYGFGIGWRKSYYLFGYIIITSESTQSIMDDINPVNSSSETEFYRVTLLKKYNGKWYIEKDMFDYKDKVGVYQLLYTNYTKKQIDKYEGYLKKITSEGYEF
jgi:hypothetical protein